MVALRSTLAPSLMCFVILSFFFLFFFTFETKWTLKKKKKEALWFSWLLSGCINLQPYKMAAVNPFIILVLPVQVPACVHQRIIEMENIHCESQNSVIFEDMAIDFIRREWKLLDLAERELY